MAVIVAHADDCAVVTIGPETEVPVISGATVMRSAPTPCSCGGLLLNVDLSRANARVSERPRPHRLQDLGA